VRSPFRLTKLTINSRVFQSGSSRQATGPGGGVLQDQLFYPWGQSWQSLGTWQEQGFAAFDYLHPSDNLYPTPFRNYASAQGRWLSPDPVGGNITHPQSLNRYAYVLNNPTSFVDPLGLDCSQVQSGTDENGDPIFTMNCTSSAPASPDYPFLWLFCSLGFGGCGGSNVGLSFPTGAPPLSIGGGGGGAGSGAGGGTPPGKPPATTQKAQPCANSGFGFGLAAGANGDAAVIGAGASATGTLGAGLFHDAGTGWSGGAFASGDAAAFVGSHVAAAPAQTGQDLSGLGLFGGGGAGLFFTNASSVQQLRGPFSALNFNVGYSFAQLQIQYATSGNTWYLQISPPYAGASLGFSVTTMKTTTAATHTGCQ
jgi:RHS repeat-associated protein